MTQLRPLVLLTRPAPASAAMAQWVAGLGVKSVQSPLMAIAPIPGMAVPDQVTGVLLSSANGVDAAPDVGARPCFVVGQRTADAATARGWNVAHVALDVRSLLQWLRQTRPSGLLAHFRGEHTTGNLAAELSAAGLPTLSIITYRQPLLPLTQAAHQALGGDQPVIVPLFSTRLARQFATQAQGRAPLHLIAISPAVATEVRHMPHETLTIVETPTGDAMRAAIAGRIDATPLLETGKTPK